MDCKALKTKIRRHSLSKMSLYVFILIVLSAVGVSFAKSSKSASTTSIPKPFFFTENKGQWDERVLYKCDAGSGLVWFLERDGFTLLATAVDKTLPLASGGTQGGVRDPMDRDLPEMLRRHPPRYPKKGHALKFKFVQEDIPPLLPPNGVRGDNLSPSQAGGRGGVYFPAQAKYFEGKSNISQPFSNNVQDVPPLLPPAQQGGIYPPFSTTKHSAITPDSTRKGGTKGGHAKYVEGLGELPSLLSPSQAGGRGGVYLPASAKYYEGLGELPWKNNYFLGSDSTKWAPNCRNFTSVYYKDVWDGIDIEWYESNGKLEFDFIVQPGANPEQIRIAVEGLEGALSLSPAGRGTQGGVDIAIGQKESHPPLVPPAQQGGKAKNDGGIDSTPLPTVSRTAVGLNSPFGSPQPKGTEGDISTPPKSPKPVSRTAGGINNPSGSPQLKGTEADNSTPPQSPKPVSRMADKWGENTPKNNPPVNGWDRISNPNTILKGKDNPPAVRGGFRGGQTVGDELILPTSLGELRTVLPKVYQIDGSGHVIDIPAKFQLIGNNDKRIHPPKAPPFTGGNANVPMADENHTSSNTDKSFETGIPETVNTFGVTLPEGYNPDHPLRIDPLIYSTFLGGSGFDYGLGICSDEDNGVFVTGITASNNFPTTPGVYDPSYSGTDDCFITHLNSNGTQLLYSTYLGNIQNFFGNAIVNDGSGGVIVTGSNGGWEGLNYDCFVAHLNPTGSQLLYYVFIGGSGDDYGYDLVNDGSGGVFVTGETGSSDFSTTVSAYDTTYNGGGDCFVFHLNSGGTLLYSTYLGGSESDRGTSIIRDGLGGVFVCGTTWSSNFPTTEDAYDTSYNGGHTFGGDVFVTHLNSVGSQLLYSTYLGGSGADGGQGIVNGNDGSIIICGTTDSPDFPTTIGAYDTSYNGGQYGDCFVARLNSSDSQLIYSTFFGGSGSEVGFSIVSDGSNGVIMTGQTTSTDFPVTVGAYDTSHNGSFDCYITKLNIAGTQLIYSTYLGGALQDFGLEIIRTSGSGNITLVGGTDSPNFPTTTTAYDTSFNGGTRDCFITRLTMEPDTNDVSQESNFVIQNYALNQNYPNPFNSSTMISYSLPRAGIIELKLYDLMGREVSTIVNQWQTPGNHRVVLDGSNLSSGIYFVTMKVGEFVQTRKIVVMK